MFVGLPGAGKTTLAKLLSELLPHTILLRGHDIVDSLDLFGKKAPLHKKRLKQRGFRYPDPWYISYLYQEALTRDLLSRGYNVVFDDHIRTRINRLGYYSLSRECGAKIIFVQINAPFSAYIKREEGKIDKKKIEFLANFTFQSQDINQEERRKYDGIIHVDGTSSISKIKRSLLREINSI